MISVVFPPEEDGSLVLKVTGHSGSGEKGRDLVCAAVSSLVLTMLGGLECEGATISGTIEDGVCDIRAVSVRGSEESFSSVARVFRFGFRRIAETYPEFVKMD